jgi:beta-galactosidase beta subunit
MIVEGMAKNKNAAILEAHDVYLDIQIPLLGELTFGLSERRACVRVKTPYSVEKDIETGKIRKAVVKVKL